MKNIIRRLFVFYIMFSVGSCGYSKSTTVRQGESDIPLASSSPIHALDLMRKIPLDASQTQLQEHIKPVLNEINRSTIHDEEQISEVIKTLRKYPQAISAFEQLYNSIPVSAYDKRFQVLSIIGKMQRNDSLGFLKSVTWSQLPEASLNTFDGCLNNQERELLLQRKAVEGIAYLKNEDSEIEMQRILKEHPSFSVRIAAIDTYSWNHNDSPEVEEQLYKLLPSELHRYVGMPRLQRGMDTQEFEKKLSSWRKRWASPLSNHQNDKQ